MPDSIFDFAKYLKNTLSFQLEDFQVDILNGGFTNLTARATFRRPVNLPPDFGYPNQIRSLILKMAKPFMHALPSYDVPMSRQNVEAKALRMLHGNELEEIVQGNSLKIPKLVYHDKQNY
ncbi:hypothetical protein FRB90_011076, partial [Tulasnella sp. 427]